MTRKLKVVTLGCSKNSVDTEHLLASLPEGMYEPAGEDGRADVMLLNTCGFIGDAKQESIEAILEAVEGRKAGLVGKIGVFGCLSQRYAAELRSEIPEVDAWFGARDLAPVLEWLGVDAAGLDLSRRLPEQRGYAYLKISEGCDVRELILIAQDTTYYGLDLYGKRSLARLAQALSGIEGIEWIRIHYSYPADFPEDLLDLMASNPKMCRYIDIPLQHISDGVLSKMHRSVNSAQTRALVAKMRERVPGVVLRTTMITGHPGEGEKEFGELLDFVREARFERLGAFPYSEEEGTYGAEHFEDSVPEEEKRRRYDRLMEVQQDIFLAFNGSRVGTVEKVIVDDILDGSLVCRSQYESPDVDGEIIVRYPGGGLKVGDFVKVRIVSADDYDLEAELV